MPMRRWILIVEPNEAYREAIRAEASYCQAVEVEIVCVSYASEMVQAMSQFGSLPEVLIVEWFASGDQVNSCLMRMKKTAMLDRLHVVAVSGESARRALCEAQALGLRRFICKFPDAVAFRKKIGEALREVIPADPILDLC